MSQLGNGWIWLPNWKEKEEEEPTIAYFRKSMILEKVPQDFTIKISADSRYKLYINGQLCEVGPSKGDQKKWFYDEKDVAPFLKEGENIWAVVVLHYPIDKNNKGNFSVFRTGTPGLYLESKTKDEHTGQPVWQTDGSWKVRKNSYIHIVSENPFFAPLQIYESATGNSGNMGWMREGYVDTDWENAVEYQIGKVSENLNPDRLYPRTIPFMRKIPGSFKGISKIVKSSKDKTEWENFLNGNGMIVIPENSIECVEIDAGELMTGYLNLKMRGGADTEIELLQSEAYAEKVPVCPESYDDLPIKGDRTDAENGQLAGYTDRYFVCGAGTEECPEKYEPFWFRSFRFIRLTIKTKEIPLILKKFSYVETGYPLEIQSYVRTSDISMENIWDISARTLKRCMHETYEDCPFYEQLQYAMDSRSQILYTYAVSADDRLARKCMDDFYRSQRQDGLLNACYPSVNTNVIPGFSIFYIGMLYDHMMYFGDKELIRFHMPVVENILNYFQSHLDERDIVEKIGDLNKPDRNWSFIDWTAQWEDTNGVPTATLHGPITMESFLYIMGLQYAEALNKYIGRVQLADEYHKRIKKVKAGINAFCRGRDGMYQDGPGYEAYSQHCQVFAVLTDTVSMEEGRKYLLKTLEHPERYAQCSVAMMYYLFRALEKCGLYKKTEFLWDIWKDMLKNHLTTCAEDPLKSRSDCHAWGALALYELPSVILGVRPAAPGYEKIEINPETGFFSQAEGQVITPKGMVTVSWKKQGEKVIMDVKVPNGISYYCNDLYN